MIIQIVEYDKALSDEIVMALDEPETSFVQSMNIKQAKKNFIKQEYRHC